MALHWAIIFAPCTNESCSAAFLLHVKSGWLDNVAGKRTPHHDWVHWLSSLQPPVIQQSIKCHCRLEIQRSRLLGLQSWKRRGERQYPKKNEKARGLCGRGEESCNAVGCCYNERAAAGRKYLQLSARQRCFPFNTVHISRPAGPAKSADKAASHAAL